MTIGTAIVISVAILCGTFLAVIGIGVAMNKKKTDAAAALTTELTNHISKKLNEKLK